MEGRPVPPLLQQTSPERALPAAARRVFALLVQTVVARGVPPPTHPAKPLPLLAECKEALRKAQMPTRSPRRRAGVELPAQGLRLVAGARCAPCTELHEGNAARLPRDRHMERVDGRYLQWRCVATLRRSAGGQQCSGGGAGGGARRTWTSKSTTESSSAGNCAKTFAAIGAQVESARSHASITVRPRRA